MPLHVVDHPLVAHRVAELRATDTAPDRFRTLVGEIAGILAYEASRALETEPVTVETPLGDAEGRRLRDKQPLVVPVLRAGLGMLDATLSMVPNAGVALLGLRRDEQTLEPSVYCDTVPRELDGRDVFVLDPMLATGGSLALACERVAARGAGPVHALCIVAAPEGAARVAAAAPHAEVWAAALDPGLNDVGYIVPGLGDAGDRLYGRVD